MISHIKSLIHSLQRQVQAHTLTSQQTICATVTRMAYPLFTKTVDICNINIKYNTRYHSKFWGSNSNSFKTLRCVFTETIYSYMEISSVHSWLWFFVVVIFQFRWPEQRLPGSLFLLPHSHLISPFTGRWFSPLRNSCSGSGSSVTGLHECSLPLNLDYQHDEPQWYHTHTHKKKKMGGKLSPLQYSKNGHNSIIIKVQGWTGYREHRDFSQWVGSTCGKIVWVTGG